VSRNERRDYVVEGVATLLEEFQGTPGALAHGDRGWGHGNENYCNELY
jgi:hypothetical protein